MSATTPIDMASQAEMDEGFEAKANDVLADKTNFEEKLTWEVQQI